MPGQLKKFQMVGFQHWKGLTNENHLGQVFQLQPQKASILMVQLLSYYGKTLDTFLSQYPVREFESDDEFYWDVLGSSRRNIPLVEARDENGEVITEAHGENVGVGFAPFYLVFAEDWFA